LLRLVVSGWDRLLAFAYTTGDTRGFIPLLLGAAVLLITGFVVAASQAAESAKPSSGSNGESRGQSGGRRDAFGVTAGFGWRISVRSMA
jgi:hypothetical protein